MIGDPASPHSPEAAEAEGRLLNLRFAGGVLGILLIAVGVVCALLVFRKVWIAVDDPRAYSGPIDRWERVLGGEGPIVEMGGVPPAEQQPAGIRAIRAERPLAVLVLVLLLWLLARIAIALIGAGGKLVQLASPWRKLLRDVLMEVRGTGPPRTR